MGCRFVWVLPLLRRSASLVTAALASCAAGALAAGVLVALALQMSDAAIFSSRAQYKPTVEQLSEQLTSIASPEEVAHAVERTVRRWLPCDHIELELAAQESESAAVQRSPTKAAPTIMLSPNQSIEADELALPVRFEGARLGTLRVGKKRGGALFTSEDLDLLKTIANQGALALAHASAYAELENRRRQQAAAWRDEREALVETLSAEIAHEVRYPINFFRSIFERARSSRALDEEDIEIGREEVDRLERLVSGPSPHGDAAHRARALSRSRSSAREPRCCCAIASATARIELDVGRRRRHSLRRRQDHADSRQPPGQRARRGRDDGRVGVALALAASRRRAHRLGHRARFRRRRRAPLRPLVHDQTARHGPRSRHHLPPRARARLDDRGPSAADGRTLFVGRRCPPGHRRRRERVGKRAIDGAT